jgi:hypothetical protein
VLLAACGAQPNQPVLANVPRPNPAAVAGVAAAAAAAVTLASPQTATARPEKNQDVEKKPIKVNESVPASVLDRLDDADANKQPAAEPGSAAPAAQPASAPSAPKPPRDALDFSQP